MRTKPLIINDLKFKEGNIGDIEEKDNNSKKTIFYSYKEIFNKIYNKALILEKNWKDNKSISSFIKYKIAKRVLRKLEKEQLAIKDCPFTKLGFGYSLSDKRKEELLEININNSNRKNHIFLFGSTGVGKTRAAELMVQQDIMAGRNVVFIDPKSDIDMHNTMFYYALKAGREKDFIFLSPIQVEDSIQVNPTSHYYIWEEIVEHVMASVPSGDAFFYNVAKETTIAIVQAIVLGRKVSDKQNYKINFDEIASYVTYNGLQNLRQNTENIRDMDLLEDKKRALRLLDQVLSSPLDYFSKVSTTLRTSLNIMTNGNIGKILGNAEKNELVERLETGKGVILLVQTGTMLARDTANVVGKEVISMIQSVVGRYYISGKSLPMPLCLYIDELSNVVYRGIQDLYNKGRGAGVWIMGMTQSIADMIAVIGEDGAKQLLDNTNTKIIMRVQDLSSAETFAMLGGTRKKYSAIMANEGGLTGREIDEQSILPEDVLRLDKREFFYFGFEGQFKGKIRKIESTPCEIIKTSILQDSTEESKKDLKQININKENEIKAIEEENSKEDEKIYYITEDENDIYPLKNDTKEVR